MQEHLFPTVPILLVYLEATNNKVFHVLADLEIRREGYLSRDNLFKQGGEISFFETPRHLAHHHLIRHHSQRPDIALITVPLLVHDLRRHVDRSTHNRTVASDTF
jgi:hypothetical protein